MIRLRNILDPGCCTKLLDTSTCIRMMAAQEHKAGCAANRTCNVYGIANWSLIFLESPSGFLSLPIPLFFPNCFTLYFLHYEILLILFSDFFIPPLVHCTERARPHFPRLRRLRSVSLDSVTWDICSLGLFFFDGHHSLCVPGRSPEQRSWSPSHDVACFHLRSPGLVSSFDHPGTRTWEVGAVRCVLHVVEGQHRSLQPVVIENTVPTRNGDPRVVGSARPLFCLRGAEETLVFYGHYASVCRIIYCRDASLLGPVEPAEEGVAHRFFPAMARSRGWWLDVTLWGSVAVWVAGVP